jgi:hypothetical protein
MTGKRIMATVLLAQCSFMGPCMTGKRITATVSLAKYYDKAIKRLKL